MVILMHLMMVVLLTKSSIVSINAEQVTNDVFTSSKDPQTAEEERQLCEYFTNIESLRKEFGTGRDLDATETRELYHRLIPDCLLNSYEQWLQNRRVQPLQSSNNNDNNDGNTQQNKEKKKGKSMVCSLAERAYLARKLAKKYARERATYMNYLLSIGVDLIRGYGMNGQSENTVEFWNTYVRRIMDENEVNRKLNKKGANIEILLVDHCLITDEYDGFLFSNGCEPVCEAILRASVRTNQAVNQWAGVKHDNKRQL